MDFQQLQKDWKKYQINNFLEKELKMPILFSYIVGSSLLGLREEKSDIDIIIITSVKCLRTRLPYTFKYEGITIHGWYESIWDNLITIEDFFTEGSLVDYKVTEDYVLDTKNTNKALKIKNFFLETKKERNFLNSMLVINKNKYLISSLANKNFIYSKFIYILLYWYTDLIKQDIDLDFLSRVKNNTINENDKNKIFLYTKEIWNYYIENDNSEIIIKYLLKKKNFLKEVLINDN